MSPGLRASAAPGGVQNRLCSPAHSGMSMGWGRRKSLPADLPLTSTASLVLLVGFGWIWGDDAPFFLPGPSVSMTMGRPEAVRRIWRFWGLSGPSASLLFRNVVCLPNDVHLWDSWSRLREGQAGGAVFTDNPVGVLTFCHWEYSEGVKVWVAQSCPTLYDHVDCGPPGYMGFSRHECWGVRCHALLQGIILIHGSNPGLLHCRQILYHLNYQGSPEDYSTKL